MGVLAPGSAHARPSAQPLIDASGHFSAHISAKLPSKFSKTLKIAPRGSGGGDQKKITRIFIIFFYEPMQKFETL
jgi:hypothetical protein